MVREPTRSGQPRTGRLTTLAHDGPDAAADAIAARHYSTHAAVLGDVPAGGRERLSAIVLAAGRPAAYARPALRLGAMLDVPVVLMCSHRARRDDAVALAERVPSATCVVIDLSAEPDVGLPRFRTSTFHEATRGSLGDLSRKRNLALLLGKLSGWSSLLFLDDDIGGVQPANVERAVAALDRHVAVGMPAVDFPDNSIVCHAHRQGGGAQGVFVSGSALAVDVQRADTFFPEIYNEDWLFLAPYLDRGEVGAVGSVRQLEYAPFANPRRAADQEFGDVLAEGLVGFLHSARLSPPPSIDYWDAFLAERAAFIRDTTAGCLATPPALTTADDPLPALDEAAYALSKISATTLVQYLDAWHRDLATWRQFVADLPSLGSLAEAVRGLELPAQIVSPRPRPAPVLVG